LHGAPTPAKSDVFCHNSLEKRYAQVSLCWRRIPQLFISHVAEHELGGVDGHVGIGVAAVGNVVEAKGERLFDYKAGSWARNCSMKSKVRCTLSRSPVNW
jgi:hypothetical protein